MKRENQLRWAIEDRDQENADYQLWQLERENPKEDYRDLRWAIDDAKWDDADHEAWKRDF